MTETKTYAAMLYRLAEEIDNEGVLTVEPERLREAAQRMDEQTVVINQLRKDTQETAAARSFLRDQDRLLAELDAVKKQRDDLLAALDGMLYATSYSDPAVISDAINTARAAIAAVRGAA